MTNPPSAKETQTSTDVVTFLRRRDYRLIRELGRGACGQTVLLHDDLIDEQFVCKKYLPYDEQYRAELFSGFVREVKLLHQVFHPNIVRVFNYYLFPAQHAGYLLMEHVAGAEIDDFLRTRPDLVNSVFRQCVAGFAHLERCGILHRDVRPGNIMVREDGVVKIIDLGFGKRVAASADFDKSITLNWWCRPPDEFKESKYDFGTEVYFVGKLFEQLLSDVRVAGFEHGELLRRMCASSPKQRLTHFAEVEQAVQGAQLSYDSGFTDEELETYRAFSAALSGQITKVERSAKYASDVTVVTAQLDDVYTRVMLEEYVPDAAAVVRCFLTGTYFYRRGGIRVAVLRDFLRLLKNSNDARRRVILGNVHSKLDAVPRYDAAPPDSDIPF